jgi:hypothetical protein
VDLIPNIAHFVILTPTGNYRFLKFKSVKNNPFWAIYACGVEARPSETSALPCESREVFWVESAMDRTTPCNRLQSKLGKDSRF